MTKFEYYQGKIDLCTRMAQASISLGANARAEFFSSGRDGYQAKLNLLSKEEAAEKISRDEEESYLELMQRVVSTENEVKEAENE